MKKFKKIVSVILSVIMVVSMTGFVLAEEATPETEIILSTADYNAANKLKAIGIIDEVSKETMARVITRRECAELMVRMLNIPVQGAQHEKSPYIDVAPSSSGIAEIITLYNMGYISRGEDLKFNPENAVTFNEAIAFVVKAMGYKVIAESNGGYPSGYLNVASRYDLLKNVKSGSTQIHFYQMYHMIAKALEAPAYTYAGSVGDEDYYSQDKDITILNEYHNMRHIQGIVTADSFSQLYSESKGVPKGQIAINGKIYDLGQNVSDNYLGKTVVAIAKNVDESEDVVIYIEESSKNVSYTLNYDELLPAKTTNQKIAYSSDDKEKYYDLDTNCRVIYNGLNWGGYHNIVEVLPTYGSVELLDNNKDGAIDVLRVMDYRNIIVGYVDEYEGVICDSRNSAWDLSYVDESKLRIYDSETLQMVTVQDLSYESVLSVAVSKSGEYVTGYVSHKIENGRIEEVTSSSPVLYKIGDNKYEIAPNTSLSIGVGTSGIFRIDHLGKIAEYVVDAGNQGGFTVAVLAGVQNNGGFKGVDLKLFNQDGTFNVLKAKEQIKIDGARKNSTENATVGLISAHIGELVRYKASDGVVSEFDFAYVTNYAGGETGVESLGSWTEITSGESIKHRNGIFLVGGRNFYMPLDTEVLFLVPDDLSHEEGYQVVTVNSQLANGHNYYIGTVDASEYNHAMKTLSVKAYNMGYDGNGCNKGTAVLMKSAAYDKPASAGNSGRGGGLLLNVVTEITDAYDVENLRNCKRIYFNDGSYRDVEPTITIQYGNGESNSVLNATLADANLNPGDLITFAPSKGTINTIKVWYRKNTASTDRAVLTNSSPSLNATSFDGEKMYVAATVKSVDIEEKIISYTTLDGVNDWMMRYGSPTVMLVRNDIAEKRIVETIDVDAIRAGDRIVFYAHLVNASFIVVYRD